MIYVGLDDTDVVGQPGTNKHARALAGELPDRFRVCRIVRHQLLFVPEIPYTSKNSSCSILLQTNGSIPHAISDLASWFRAALPDRCPAGSDPGLCVAGEVADEIRQFGRLCQQSVVTQSDARRLAERHVLYLEGLGGTQDGVIGALAAIGLAATGDDGRVVQIERHPDDLHGPCEVRQLWDRGVNQIVCRSTGRMIEQGNVDIGKRLRPNLRGGNVVLYVEPNTSTAEGSPPWQAIRLP